MSNRVLLIMDDDCIGMRTKRELYEHSGGCTARTGYVAANMLVPPRCIDWGANGVGRLM